MARLGVVSFTGKSGILYKFNVYPLGTAFKKGLCAVYVVTRRKQLKSGATFSHKRIRTSQSEDIRQPLSDKGESLVARGANCVCVHGEKNRAVRLGIQHDLIRGRRLIDGLS